MSIVAVTKSVPIELIRAALESGLSVLGENRVQEAESKPADLPGARWHFLGRLQSNKATRAVGLFEAIHSVDSVQLAERLARIARDMAASPYPIYVQVNIDRDPAKGGISPDAAAEAIDRIAAFEALDVRGLMTLGRQVGDPEITRASFAALRELSAELRARIPALGPGLSMGMSDDFEVAVEEGATVVRLGRAIFGERPVA